MESRFFAGHTEDGYMRFSRRLIPTALPIEGVRIPTIKKIAKSLAGDKAFLSIVPATHEEVLLCGLVLAASKLTLPEFLRRVDGFLPMIDNWAICDTFVCAAKFFGKHRAEVLQHFAPLVDAPALFDRRFLAVLLMSYFFVDDFVDGAVDLLLKIKTGEYYVDMAVAWAIATLAAKYFDKAYAIMTGGSLSSFVLQKSISKSLESYRLTPQQKDSLRALRASQKNK